MREMSSGTFPKLAAYPIGFLLSGFAFLLLYIFDRFSAERAGDLHVAVTKRIACWRCFYSPFAAKPTLHGVFAPANVVDPLDISVLRILNALASLVPCAPGETKRSMAEGDGASR